MLAQLTFLWIAKFPYSEKMVGKISFCGSLTHSLNLVSYHAVFLVRFKQLGNLGAFFKCLNIVNNYRYTVSIFLILVIYIYSLKF